MSTDQPAHGQHDTGRDRQIEATVDAIRQTTRGGLLNSDIETIAAAVVDAVQDAGQPIAVPQLTDEEAEELKQRWLETMRHPMRTIVLPPDPADEVERVRAETWAEAVQALRDLSRYKQWITSQGFDDYHRWYGQARRTLADYLEAVGPGGTGQGGEPTCANTYYAHGPHQWAELRDCPGWPIPQGQKLTEENTGGAS